MRFKGVGKKATAVLTAGLFFAALIFYIPNPASATPYVPLGTSSSYSLISNGALVLGATTQFSGDAPVKGACPTCTETMVTDILARGLTLLRSSDTATAAVTAVTSARTLLIGLTKTQTIDATTAITVLNPGVYETTSNAALGVTTSFTLDGGGNLDSVFVFRTTAEINFTASIEILLTNGAQASNVYWVAGTAITTGASSKIPGNLIAQAAITTGDSTIVRGSILGLGAVTLGASTSIIHYAAMTPPTALVATAENSQASLTWSAPTSTGGAILSDYLIQYTTDGTTYNTFSHTASIATSSTVTGLNNGTAYTFRVSAITASGTGPSSVTTSATPRTIPSAPLTLAATVGVSQVALTWNVPTSNGGSIITGYSITSSPLVTAPAGCTNTPNLSCTFTGLTNGTSYTFTAVAINVAGPSAASVSVSATPAALTAEQIEAARLAALEADRLAAIVADNARIAAANAEAARLAEIARASAVAAENARIAAATAELARLAEIARAAAVEAARLAAIEAERARLAEIARLAELERIANCKSTISNIQYSAAAPGSAFGHLSWTTTGTGVFQYFGDTFLYPAFMQYGIYTAEWKGYLINLVPGVRYQVSVNYLSDCGQISGVSMTIMNEKEVALVVPISTPSPTPTPAPSLIIQIPIPVVTKTPAPIELVRPIKTNKPAPIVTVKGIDYKTVTMKPTDRSTVHVALHNLVPGQKVIITLRTVEP